MKNKLLIFLFLISCNSIHHKQADELNISIRLEQSYEFDLGKKTYTVFLHSGPVQIKFNLKGEEEKKIKELYYSLKLHDFGNVEINDTCRIHPRICTYINVKSNSIDQEIKIDEGCKSSNADLRAEKVNSFLKLVADILDSKQELKNAPQSDIEYI